MVIALKQKAAMRINSAKQKDDRNKIFTAIQIENRQGVRFRIKLAILQQRMTSSRFFNKVYFTFHPQKKKIINFDYLLESRVIIISYFFFNLLNMFLRICLSTLLVAFTGGAPLGKFYFY